MERIFTLVSPKLLGRLARLALFAGLIVLFRHLLVLLVFFVAFERSIGAASDVLARRGVPKKASVLGLALALLGVVAGAGALGVGRLLRDREALKASMVDWITRFRETALFGQIRTYVESADSLADKVQHYAGEGVRYATAAGHVLLYLLIGFILAIVYLLEREELDRFAQSLAPTSLLGTFNRWLAYVADAVSVTLQFQVIVAACNAVLTFPILWLIGVPHKVALLFMIFFSGMVPVVGNFVAGAVLTLLAFQSKGWTGVIVFSVLTFVLHKMESYYLNPRLARRHVRLPGFVLIVSLILWEHLLGFKGLFVSFPFLYIVFRVRDEFATEDRGVPPAIAEAERATAS